MAEIISVQHRKLYQTIIKYKSNLFQQIKTVSIKSGQSHNCTEFNSIFKSLVVMRMSVCLLGPFWEVWFAKRFDRLLDKLHSDFRIPQTSSCPLKLFNNFGPLTFSISLTKLGLAYKLSPRLQFHYWIMHWYSKVIGFVNGPLFFSTKARPLA